MLQLGDRQSDPNAHFVDTTRHQPEYFMLHDNSPDPGQKVQRPQRLTLGLQDDDSHPNTSSSMSHITGGNELDTFKGNFEACVEARY